MIIQSTNVWVVNTWLAAQIVIENGKIIQIQPHGKDKADEDHGSDRIVPGFIDIHTHGAYGFDTNDAEPEGLRSWARQLPREGVTSFLATTITQSREVLTKALKNVADVAENGYEGAEILGVHLEGPYLDRKYKGAQPEQYCVPPDVEEFVHYQAASGGRIRVITMACEHDEDFALTRYCAANGVVVSQGHSRATFEEAAMAIANGARSMTHVHNAMPPYHHREPSLVGAAYRFSDVYGEIICDGIHVTADALHNFFAAKGADCGIMVTDSLLVKGMPAGSTGFFGGNPIEMGANGCAYLQGTDKLAGSTLSMDRGLSYLTMTAQVPWQSAINACTINPARLLGVDDRKGSITAGKDADLAVLSADGSVRAAYARGIAQKVFGGSK